MSSPSGPLLSGCSLDGWTDGRMDGGIRRDGSVLKALQTVPSDLCQAERRRRTKKKKYPEGEARKRSSKCSGWGQPETDLLVPLGSETTVLLPPSGSRVLLMPRLYEHEKVLRSPKLPHDITSERFYRVQGWDTQRAGRGTPGLCLHPVKSHLKIGQKPHL